jgi:Domain of unknown function (DUF4397)
MKNFLFLCLTFCFLAGCKKEETAQVKFINAVPNTRQFDLYFEYIKVNAAPLPFLSSTEYRGVANPRTGLLFANYGNTILRMAIDSNAVLNPLKHYTAMVCDTTNYNNNFFHQLAYFEDDLTSPPAGKARIRFIHAIPTSIALDCYKAGETTPLFPTIPFKGASDFVNVDPGVINLEIRVEGSPANFTPFFTYQYLLEEGKIYTVLAKGLLGVTGGSAKAFGGAVVEHN